MADQRKRRGRTASIEVIEAKLEKAKDRVISTKKAAQEAEEEYKRLLSERDKLRKEKLYKLVAKSSRTYEEIVRFLESESEVET